MFDKFTGQARRVVVEAQRVAVECDAREIEALHLAQALLNRPGVVSEVLTSVGVAAREVRARLDEVTRRGGLSEVDAEALAQFGIDVERVVESVEQVHGEHALSAVRPRGGRGAFKHHRPFAREAKQVLERTLSEAHELGERRIGPEHVLLALVHTPGPAADVLRAVGVDSTVVRRHLTRRCA